MSIMTDSVKHCLEKIFGTKNSDTIKNINGTQADSPRIEEQITDQIEDIPKPLFRGDELKRDLYHSILDCYPEIKKLNVNILPSKTYIGNGKYVDRYYINVTWENGVSECRVNSIVDCLLTDYFDEAQGHVTKSMVRLQLIRMFSDSVILKVSRKYANCIAPNLPLNLHNIHCFKVGEVPIYDLAVGELRLMDEIE